MAASRKAVTKKSVKKSATKKAPAKKGSPKKTPAKKVSTKKAPAKKSSAKKGSPKKTPAKKAPKKSASRKASKKPSAENPANSPLVKTAPKKSAKKAPAPPVSTNARSVEASSRVGKEAPSFELQDQSGAVVSSASLNGKPYVLYFYPKDNTPGCTQESCDFRDQERNFRAAGVTIFGVSPDSVKSHAGFASKFELPFPLLSDPDKQLAQAYGVWALKKNYGKEYWGIVRSTFLVDKNGKVASEWRQVRVNGHAAAVLDEAKK